MSPKSTPRSNGAGSDRGHWLSLATYAEERDSWAPSYRARIDAQLMVSDGTEQRVRREDGSEMVATWSEGRVCGGGCWRDEDDQPIEDVTHVWLGQARASRSGAKSALPRVEFHANSRAVALWKRATEAATDAESLSDWIRSRLTIMAAEELGLDPVETLGQVG